MKRSLLAISSLFISLLALGQADSLSSIGTDSLLQVITTDTLSNAGGEAPEAAEEPTIPKRPFNVALHIDYGKVLTLPFPFEYKVEGGIVLELLERIELVGEIGYWEKDARKAIENGNYTATGTYMRAGAGFIMPFNQPGSQIGFGFRYAVSNFKDEGQYEISETGDLIEPYTSSFERDNLSATWMSGVLTSMSSLKLRKAVPEAKINRMLKIGLLVRYRFLISYDKRQSPEDPIEVFTIPGFGRTLSDSNLAFNIFIRFYPFGF